MTKVKIIKAIAPRLARKGSYYVKERNRIFNRYMMTVDEAGAYFHIGARKMRELVREHEGAKWMLYNGNRVMIKRELFQKLIDQQTVI